MIFDFLLNNLATIVVFCVLFILTWIMIRTQRPHGIPPGPTPLPLVGNIFSLRGDVRVAFKKLRGQYGDIFSVYMGNSLAVVVNGYDLIKEVFVKNGEVFSDRPFVPKRLITRWGDSEGIIRASGEAWKMNRRFALSTLRDFGMGKNLLQSKIQEEVAVLIRAIEDQRGAAFDMKDLIQNAVSNIICSIVFGKRFSYDDMEFQRYLTLISTLFSSTGAQRLAQVFPVLNKLPGMSTRQKRLRNRTNEIVSFISDFIMEHKRSFDENNIRSLIDAFIKQEKLHKQELSSDDICGTELPRIIFDLFLAGTETTATVLMWTFLYFLHHPDIQDKVNEQVTNAVKEGCLPGMEDRARMPYLEATVKEVLRHADIAPLSVPHAVQEDTKVRGYDIPKGTVAFLNIDSVMTDGNLWTKPEEFNPDRFLNAEASKKLDYFIPFGLGKRVCLGESLARMELTIFLASLTKHFKFVTAHGEEPPPLEGKLGTTFSPNRYMIRAIKRSEGISV